MFTEEFANPLVAVFAICKDILVEPENAATYGFSGYGSETPYIRICRLVEVSKTDCINSGAVEAVEKASSEPKDKLVPEIDAPLTYPYVGASSVE